VLQAILAIPTQMFLRARAQSNKVEKEMRKK